MHPFCQWLRWHSQAHVLLAGTSVGGGWMWKVPGGDCKTFQGQNCRNICSSIMPDGIYIYVIMYIHVQRTC